jgi:hypothetical protein
VSAPLPVSSVRGTSLSATATHTLAGIPPTSVIGVSGTPSSPSLSSSIYQSSSSSVPYDDLAPLDPATDGYDDPSQYNDIPSLSSSSTSAVATSGLPSIPTSTVSRPTGPASSSSPSSIPSGPVAIASSSSSSSSVGSGASRASPSLGPTPTDNASIGMGMPRGGARGQTGVLPPLPSAGSVCCVTCVLLSNNYATILLLNQYLTSACAIYRWSIARTVCRWCTA